MISRSNQYELLMLQSSQSLALQNKKEVLTATPSGCSVSDVIKLLKSNKAIKHQIQQITFNINAYNNRQTVAGNPGFVSMQRNDGDQGRKGGYRLSNNLKISEISTSYYGSNDPNSYSLYCINIRALNQLTYPELAVRKLSKFDDLYQIEDGNRQILKALWLRHADMSFRMNIPINVSTLPQFKYVYCSPLQINQIVQALALEEVSFPQEPFVKYLQSLVKNQI